MQKGKQLELDFGQCSEEQPTEKPPLKGAIFQTAESNMAVCYCDFIYAEQMEEV